MADVRVENLTKSYGPARALDDVSMAFPDGSFFGLLGPSGSGKTTLLRAIAGFVLVDSGFVRIGGEPVENVPVEKREVGMVFQNYALFPNMTVEDNIGFGLRVRNVSAAEEKRRVAEALDLVQLGPLGGRKPHQLSGGQRQRVAMARAIVTRPRVLLLDEPLSALDKSLRVDMQIELKRIQREVGITTIFVTHDQEEALTLSDKIGILKDGRLVRAGTPRDVYDNPGDAFTARFLGEANLFTGALSGRSLRLKDGSVVALPGAGAATETVAVRPENMSLSVSRPDSGNAVPAVLRQRIFAGAMGTCVLDWQGETLKVIARDRDLDGLPDSGPVWLCWAPGSSVPINDGPA